ncbi:MAG: response regulator [Hyphomicrobiales bacterium]
MILLVHHRASFRRVLAAALAPLGLAVVAAPSAEQALALIDEDGQHFALLITAHVLPGLGGVELAQRFRERFGPSPVIITSAYAAPPSGSCDLFVREPFDVEQLAETAQQMLVASSAAACRAWR